jgi:pepF/M3 family oligoendopeptidase
MVATVSTLPHWDMTGVYPSLDSPQVEEAILGVVTSLEGLKDLFDRLDVRGKEAVPIDERTLAAFEEALGQLNEVLTERVTVASYIAAHTATDSRDNLAQALWSRMQGNGVLLSKLYTRFTAWIGSFDVDELIARSQAAREHAYMLRKASEAARHLMSPEEEDLAAEMRLTGGMAWGKLHNNLTSQLVVPVADEEGEIQALPMSAVRNLAYSPDRGVRKRAYEAELKAWQGVALPVAAALNGVKGEANTLAKRRGWESALDESLFDSNIDRRTLDAMMEAAREAFPDFRRYLRAKTRALGLEKLAWYDILAPAGGEERPWGYDEAESFIVEQFGSYSQKMSEFAARAFRERWVDAEPRVGKRDGAFCMFLRNDESRVFMNYKPSFGSVSTLAHELGHAYHNLVKSPRTMLQRATPMTLAETASIFCETIVEHAMMKKASREEQVGLLEASLQRSFQVVVDITSRFLFESRVFEKRQERELSVDELNALMLDAQRETYGDGLDEGAMHPYMWAMKPHYYRSDLSFYNYPYMFGLLFGLGLYAQYKDDPEGFKAGYDDLLSSTGLDDAATLASRFGIDVRTPAFWRSSLDVIRTDIAKFEGLVG